MDESRTPEEINEILDDICRVWIKYPELRLGQLISNSLFMRSPSAKTNINAADIFFVEDEALIDKINRFDKEIGRR